MQHHGVVGKKDQDKHSALQLDVVSAHLGHVEVVNKHSHVLSCRWSIHPSVLLLQPAVNDILQTPIATAAVFSHGVVLVQKSACLAVCARGLIALAMTVASWQVDQSFHTKPGHKRKPHCGFSHGLKVATAVEATDCVLTCVMFALVCALKVTTIDTKVSCGRPVCRCFLTYTVLPVPVGPTSRQWWW
jgi:hypothetical protein